MRASNNIILALALLLGACQTVGTNTIGELRKERIVLKDEKIEDAAGKARENYRRYLEETPDSVLRAEAIRRLADLKGEREPVVRPVEAAAVQLVPDKTPPAPERAVRPEVVPTRPAVPAPVRKPSGIPPVAEEKRSAQVRVPAVSVPAKKTDDPEEVGAREAVELYQKLLKDYPSYEHNDQVLYQLSRAYEDLGRVEDAVQVMGRLALEHPKSRYVDEVQFRRGEYFFTRRRFADAADAYGSVVSLGASSSYFQLALYKLGWSLYKQELYDKALERFVALLDHKVSLRYEFSQTRDEAERKRMDDVLRVISLSFSNIGGPGSVVEYFARHGRRSYEDLITANFAEFYFEKRRYGDAVAVYTAFVENNPFHRASPRFQMRVIEIHLAGGFPSLAIDAKNRFVHLFGLQEPYWRHFERSSRPEVMPWLKTNLTDLAKHYHALYQRPKLVKDRQKNYEEAVEAYREFIASFPADPEAPAFNYMLADLYLENRAFDLAAEEYEKTSYRYPRHERSSKAGYAAIFALRQHLAGVAPDAKAPVIQEIARISAQFAVVYPEHEKAAIALGAAVDDLYVIRDYVSAGVASRKLVDWFPKADAELLRRAWLVNGHANFELRRYGDAEDAYTQFLELLPRGDTRRDEATDNLASAIYKQGEERKAEGHPQAAAGHYLRLGTVAPNSRIRVNAEYDGAAALIEAKQWSKAVEVLKRFRKLFPGHALQPEVTRKIAFAYRESGEPALAAVEYERSETESTDTDVRREALLVAMEQHQKAGNQGRLLAVSRRYVEQFPQPVEPNLEVRSRIAEALKKNDQDGYRAELGRIVAVDAGAGGERTPRTRFIAAQAALTLAEHAFGRFAAVKLAEPFEANLNRKKELMKAATQQFNSLIDYELGDFTAAAAFYLAEIYADFSSRLKESERPRGLSALEREQYDLALEEQAYPFEEKSIATHQSNLELVSRGVYNEWIEKSLRKLAALVPARYDKPEEGTPVITSVDTYVFVVGAGNTGGKIDKVNP